MVAQCANPACDREFRELSKGRLFALPPTRHVSPATWGDRTWGDKKLSDYCYWLCPECAVTHTITRDESEVVVSKRNTTLLGSSPSLPPRSVGGARSGIKCYTETA
jgi:hypothetical protein